MIPKTFAISAGLPAILLAAALAVGPGCSKTNSESVALTPQGTHPAGWDNVHGAFAKPDGAACVPCHGSAIDPAASGGIANVSCFSGPRGAQWCHATGPAFHPPDWLDKGGAHFHGAAFVGGTLINGMSCASCHRQADPPSFICLDCHFTIDGGRVPVGSAWTHGDIGGHTAFGVLDVVNAVNGVCIRCHNTNNAFGHMPQPFCHNCHSPAPAGFHPAGWANPDSHGAAAKLAPGAGTTGFPTCQGCHGTNLDGVGGSAPSCINNALCHGSGIASPHSPSPWRVTPTSPPNARRHTNTDNTVPGNPGVCALCHFGGGIHAPTPPPPGSTPQCFNNTLCHGPAGAAPHPVRPYLTHPADALAQFSTFCNTCHSISPPRLTANAPACTECHKGGNPLTVTNCTSCHAAPPNGAAPVGSVFPNVAGAHAKHNALAGITGICNNCHNGGGTGTGLEHFYDNTAGLSGIDVALTGTTYQAKAGAFAFNADNTCTNVSCHGGITTPTWRTGAIVVNSDAGCRQCHRPGTSLGVPENNSNYSGQHSVHSGYGCTECHNMALATTGAQNHFKFLATAAMEGPASDTFQNSTGTVVYNAAGGTCTGSCHGQTHSAFPW